MDVYGFCKFMFMMFINTMHVCTGNELSNNNISVIQFHIIIVPATCFDRFNPLLHLYVYVSNFIIELEFINKNIAAMALAVPLSKYSV